MSARARLRSAAALCALAAAALAALSSTTPTAPEWVEPVAYDFGPRAFPTGAGASRRVLEATLSAQALPSNPPPIPLLLALSSASPDGGALLLTVFRVGADGGSSVRTNALGDAQLTVQLFSGCATGPCVERYEVSLSPESFSAPRVDVTRFTASAELRLPPSQPPDGGALILREP